MRINTVFCLLILVCFNAFACNAQNIDKPQGDDDYRELSVAKSGLLKTVVFCHKKYVVCEADPRVYKIETFNRNKRDGSVYTLRKLAQVKGDKLVFAMNGGMYKEDFMPLGLLVSDGKTSGRINNAKKGYGNFYMMPNGIFMLDRNNKPAVVTTEAFVKSGYKPEIATQSGPMLVTDGIFNPAFQKNSTNVLVRNGVGVNASGNVVMVLAVDPVNFYEFATLFRDKLKCRNALYLDGVVSQYLAPSVNLTNINDHPLAVFLTVSSRENNNSDRKAPGQPHNKH